MIKQKVYSPVLLLAIATFILILFGLYNGFPIISGDTMKYLESGADLRAAAERPIFYGLFIRFTGGFLSIWLTVVAQCLILAYLLRHFLKSHLPHITQRHIVALLFIISLGTICSWYASQLMPDIFTPILFLAIFLFLKSTTKRHSIIFFSLCLLATLVHFSHYVIFTLFSLALIFVSLLKTFSWRPLRSKVIMLFIGSLFCWLSLLTSNYFSGRGFVTSSVSHVFLMGKLSESGVLKTYLNKACPSFPYKICKYQDSLPPVAWEFVWDEARSPVFKEGGWDSVRAEYKTIIRDIASRPKYWPFLAYKSMEATARQVILTNIDEGEERPWLIYSSSDVLYQDLKKYFPHESQLFLSSRQNNKVWNLVFYDDLYILVIAFSSLLVLFFMNAELRKKYMPVYLLLVLFILLNAFATATFGNVLSRLNSRTIWLLPMLNIVFLYDFFTLGHWRKLLSKEMTPLRSS